MLFATGCSKDIFSNIGCLLCFTARVSVNSGLTETTDTCDLTILTVTTPQV